MKRFFLFAVLSTALVVTACQAGLFSRMAARRQARQDYRAAMYGTSATGCNGTVQGAWYYTVQRGSVTYYYPWQPTQVAQPIVETPVPPVTVTEVPTLPPTVVTATMPNCECGCVSTGKCVCKDCDHPAKGKKTGAGCKCGCVVTGDCVCKNCDTPVTKCPQKTAVEDAGLPDTLKISAPVQRPVILLPLRRTAPPLSLPQKVVVPWPSSGLLGSNCVGGR